MSLLSSVARPMPVQRARATVTVALVAGLAALSGCGGDERSPTLRRPETPAPVPSAEVAAPADTTATPALVRPVLATPVSSAAPLVVSDLATLVRLAQERHPTAAAIAATRRAAEARIAQAGAWANPELELTYGRTKPRVSYQQTDNPYGGALSQRFEWWGKRQARIAAAQAEAGSIAAQADLARLELEVEVRLAAIVYASARAAADQSAAQAALGRDLLAIVEKRTAAGDIDLGEAARVKVDASTAKVRHESALRERATRLAVLRTWCGNTLADDLTVDDALATAAAHSDSAAVHPRVRAAQEAERAAAAQVDAERQARFPDVTIGVFGDREWEQDTLGVSLGVELPVWNRNAGGIAMAEAERARLAAERRGEELRLTRERAEALGVWEQARAEITVLDAEALPAALDAVRLRTAAYTAGDASLADVLDARRALIAVQADLLAARRTQAEAQVRLIAFGTTTAPVAGSHP